MKVEIRNFDLILPDNEQMYFSMLEGAISSIDVDASVIIIKGLNKVYFRISPSEPVYSQILLDSILKLHNLMGIILNFSKSIRLTSTISFNINFK